MSARLPVVIMSGETIALTTRNRHGTLRPSIPPPDDPDDFGSTPTLPPVPRAKQATVLLAAFLAICLTIGYNQCYGVFQEYYLSPSQSLLQPPPSSMDTPPTAQLAFVGTLGAGLTWAGSIFVNPLISRIEYLSAIGNPVSTSTTAPRSSALHRHLDYLLRSLTARHVTLLGVVLMSLGFFLASLSRAVPQLLLTQGLLYGLGSSLLYFPLLGPAPEYFTNHRATALGLILSGGGAGGLILSPVLRALLSSVGGIWTLRVLAGTYLLVGTPIAWAVPRSRFPAVVNLGRSSPAALSRPSSGIEDGDDGQPASAETGEGGQRLRVVARRRTHISTSLAVTPVFLLSAAAAFCQAAGAQLPLTFIPTYSVALGLTAARGATLLAVANVVNAIARVATGYAGDRLGRLNTLVASLLAAFAAVLTLWLGSITLAPGQGSSQSGVAVRLWLAFIVLYSVAAGGYYALFPATIADVFGIRSYAAVNGFIYFVRGCGTMVGSPVGGTLLGRGGGQAANGYADVVAWDSALLLVSALCVLGIRWADALRRGWMWRA